MKHQFLNVIRVFRSPGDGRAGRLLAGSLTLPCALGRSGIGRAKREGDGRTPPGRFRLRAGFYRADRLPRPRTRLDLARIRPDDGWCDDSRSPLYNRPMRLPACWGHERLWREDGLYDLVLDIAYNRGPIRRGRGSAIFLHCARPDLGPTEGCVAVPRPALRRLLPLIGPRTILQVGP